MKIRIGFLSLLATVSAFSAWSQTAEYDDMYFNAKDRARVTASKPLSMYSAPMENNQVVTPINPTDSYSARNVNPEYIAQSKITTSTSEESVPYFVSNYAPTGVNQNISNYNNSYPYNYYNNYYGGMGYYGSPYSPYYSGMASMMYSPYSYGMSPYSGFSPYGYGMYPASGWSTMMRLGVGYGSGMWGNPYMGMGMGYGCMTCYSSFYGGYGMMMNPWGYGGYYPANVVVVNSDNVRPVTYGKRTSRSNDLNNVVYNNNRPTGTTTTAVLDSNGKVRGSGGRTSGNEPGSYYQRGWRENPSTRPSSAWSDSGSRSSGSNNSWYNSGSRSGSSSDSFFNSGSRSSGWSGGSSSGFSSGGGSRSSGGMSGGGSSGGRRGRD